MTSRMGNQKTQARGKNSRKRWDRYKLSGVGPLMNTNCTCADENDSGRTAPNAEPGAPSMKTPDAPPPSVPEIARCQGCRCNLISGDWCNACQPKPDVNAPGLYTVGQAAKLLKVPQSRIQELLRRGAPCLRVGRAVRVRLEDLRERIADDDGARRNFQWLMDHGPE